MTSNPATQTGNAALERGGYTLKGLLDSGLGGVPREQKMLKGHLPRVIYHRIYLSLRRLKFCTCTQGRILALDFKNVANSLDSCNAQGDANGSNARVEFLFIDNLLVRIHVIIVMIRWTGLAPWEFEFPVPGSLTSTFLACVEPEMHRGFDPLEDLVQPS